MWALVVLTLLAVMMTLITRQGLTALRLVERRQQQLQAEWLARSGIELAAARLLAAPDSYEGESVQPIPGSKVTITVTKKESSQGVYSVAAEARYPFDESNVVVRTASRSFRLVTEKATTRVVAVPVP